MPVPIFKSRIAILAALLTLCFSVVIGRLFQLQILNHDKYLALANRDNSIAKLVPAMRGVIRDRDGNILAEDQPVFDLAVRLDRVNFARVTLDDAKPIRDPQATPEQRKERADLLRRRIQAEPYIQNLAATIGVTPEDLAAEFFKAMDNLVRQPKPWATPSTPQTIARGIDEDIWLALRAVHEDTFRNSALNFSRKDLEKFKDLPEAPFPGLTCNVSTRRIYPYGTLAAHVLGGVGELSEEDQAQLQQSGVLLENAELKLKLWKKTRDALNESQAAELDSIFQVDVREIDDVGQLYETLARLTPEQKVAAARLGLAAQIKWTDRPPRMFLSDAERLWLGVGMPLSGSRNLLTDRLTGESGVERFYNDPLRGKHGFPCGAGFQPAPVPANFTSSPHHPITSSPEPTSSPRHPITSSSPYDAPPTDGAPLTLTLSMKWQQAAEKELAAALNERGEHYRGACVVLDCRNGEILALASNPTFDPNLFTPPRSGSVVSPLPGGGEGRVRGMISKQAALKALFEDPSKPLLNRAISGEYPLGSIMKSIVAAAALERGLLTPDETFNCPGYIKEGGQTFHCDGHHAHGTVNVYKGLRCSCNVMFHQVGARLGVEQLGVFAKHFLGTRTGIDLPAEAAGVYPDRAWRTATFPNNPAARIWTRGNDFLLAIGQGQMNSTVLQAAVMIAAIGNGGQVITPHIWLERESPPAVSLGLSERSLTIVRRGLEECVNVGTPGERGTAYKAFHSGAELPFKVAGKTSSAEHKKGAECHAWFAGYCPAENPQIAFAIVLEEAGHGGEKAAPVIYKILKDVYAPTGN